MVVSGKSKLPPISEFGKYQRKDIPKLRYAMFHSRVGYLDGVSIVMKQIEHVMENNLHIPEENIYYLVGKSKTKGPRIFEEELLYDMTSLQKMVIKHFKKGFGGRISERLEKAITIAEASIEKFINENKIDVIIAHNTCHPWNFIMAVALSRYYRDAIKRKKCTPKYLLWWHDSHLERDLFKDPAPDVQRYLFQGIPGRFVEYIFFINSLQFSIAENYFRELDKTKKGFFDAMYENHDVIYNTTDTFIESYNDLRSTPNGRIDMFLKDFKIMNLLRENNTTLENTIFCLQHTRAIDRKRIDFALKYSFELLDTMNKKRKKKKSLYFLISGHSDPSERKKIEKVYNKLSQEYSPNNFFLTFAEDYYEKTDIKFEEYPRIIARLGGYSTYFSEIEGFGNNLLEVLASGLIPVVYTYPVFKSDIAKYKFKLVALENFEVDKESIKETIFLLKNGRKRKSWVNKNLEILKKKFPHKIIALKLTRGIIRNRIHP